MEALVNLKCKV